MTNEEREGFAREIINGKSVEVVELLGHRTYDVSKAPNVKANWVFELAELGYRVAFRQGNNVWCQVMTAKNGGGVWALTDESQLLHWRKPHVPVP